jgi:hypothetical protein
MAQKIVTLCDPHQRHDEEVPGAPWTVTLQGPEDGRPTTWAIDLCEDDGKTLVDLASMLDAVGRVVDGPRRKVATAARKAARAEAQAHHAPVYRNDAQRPVEAPRTAEGFPCPVDGCGKVPSTHAALSSHLRSFHGTSIAAATGQPEPFQCPECDFSSARPQGLGAHRRSAHGVAGAKAE